MKIPRIIVVRGILFLLSSRMYQFAECSELHRIRAEHKDRIGIALAHGAKMRLGGEAVQKPQRILLQKGIGRSARCVIAKQRLGIDAVPETADDLVACRGDFMFHAVSSFCR